MSGDPREVIAETVSDIRCRAGAYSLHAFMLATADMLAGVAERHTDIAPGWSCTPETCETLTQAMAICEAWRAADRTEGS